MIKGQAMAIAIVTGSAGLIGAEVTRTFHGRGMNIVGIDNNLRQYFFGPGASTQWSRLRLENDLKNYTHFEIDIRDTDAVDKLFGQFGKNISVVIHTAAQPSHDWAASDPIMDFSVNANGTMVLLEAVRKHCPEASFIFCSTNKVYGDMPNSLPLVETPTRWELSPDHAWAERGIDESMSIDGSMHSLFGVSKAAADLMVQEYGRYFGMNTVCFRGGCLTGPGHSGAPLHGFLSYLVRCAVTDVPYTVHGYKGKQVRDNIHSHDVAEAFWNFYCAPRQGEVYNIGGGRFANCSMLEAIGICERLIGRPMQWTYSEESRAGDHIWWVSDMARFRAHYPNWRQTSDISQTIEDIYAAMVEREKAGKPLS